MGTQHRWARTLRLAVVGVVVVAATGVGGLAVAADRPAAQVPVQSPAIPPASTFSPITPIRVLDTRALPASAPLGPIPHDASPLGPGETRNLALTGVLPPPIGHFAPALTGVAMNITVDQDATLRSYLTVWPAGEPRPVASAINAEPGTVRANSISVKVGTGNTVSIFNQQGTVNVIVDVVGYYLPVKTPTAVIGTPLTMATNPIGGAIPVAISSLTQGTYHVSAELAAMATGDLTAGATLRCALFKAFASHPVPEYVSVEIPPLGPPFQPTKLMVDEVMDVIGIDTTSIHSDHGDVSLTCEAISHAAPVAEAISIERASIVATPVTVVAGASTP